MAAGRIIVPNYMPALDLNGNPLGGAKLYFYTNGTTTLATTYTSAALSVAHPNPVIANAAGVFPSIFADTTTAFSVSIRDADDMPISGLRDNDDLMTSVVYGTDIMDAAEEALEGAEAAAAAAAASEAAAEDAEQTAEEYKDLVIAALGQAATITGLNEPYESLALAEAATIPLGVKVISTRFFAPVYTDQSTLHGGAKYVRISLADITALGLTVDALITERPYFRSVDRFMPDGTTDATNGGYWILAPGQIFTPGMFGHFGNDGANGTGTTKVQCLLNYIDDIGGGEIWWPKGNGYYYQGRPFVRNNTTIRFEPGTVVKGTPVSLYNAVTAPHEGNNVFRLFGDNIQMVGYGTTFICDVTGTSACFYINGCKNVLVEGLRFEEGGFDGSGETKDCVYIGASTGLWSEGITLRNCTMWHGQRNNLAIVSARHVLIEGCEIYECLGPSGPRAGIDIEANDFDRCSYITIRNNRIHGNPQWGISSIFSDHVFIYDNEIYDNGSAGVAIAAGGAQFNSNRARSDIEWRAVSAIDTATDELTITGGTTLQVGHVVLISVRGAGVAPTLSPSATRYYVYSKSADNTKIKLSSVGLAANDITAAGSGTLTSDPTTSEIYLTCYSQEGQASDTHIFRNKLYGNGGLTGQVDLNVCSDAFVYDNDIRVTTNIGVRASQSFNVTIARNQIRGLITDATAASRGIEVANCAHATVSENNVSNIYGPGLNLSNLMLPRPFRDNNFTNCGRGATASVLLDSMIRFIIRGGRIRNDPAHPSTYGVRAVASGNVTYGLFDGVDAETAGTSNTTSLSIASTGNKLVNCVQYDGTRTSTMTGWQTSSGTGDFTLTPYTSSPNVRATATITADRTVTLSTTNASTETEFYIVRTGSGAFNLSIGGLKNLVTNSWCRVRYNGSAYELTGYGTL